MLDFFDTARGVQILYEYAKDEILESDFFDLPPEGYRKLPESEKGRRWYMLNPEKLNKNYVAERAFLIIDEREKEILLRAVRFINKSAAELPTNASFLEKLLYTKQFVPACLYSSKSQEKNNNADIVQLVPPSKS